MQVFPGGEGLLCVWRSPFHSVPFSTIGSTDLLYGLLLFLMRAALLVQGEFYFFFSIPLY